MCIHCSHAHSRCDLPDRACIALVHLSDHHPPVRCASTERHPVTDVFDTATYKRITRGEALSRLLQRAF